MGNSNLFLEINHSPSFLKYHRLSVMNIRILNKENAWKIAGKLGIVRKRGIRRKMRRDININNINIKKEKLRKKINGNKRENKIEKMGMKLRKRMDNGNKREKNDGKNGQLRQNKKQASKILVTKN